MKFKKILGLGDSWMYGDELLDPDLSKIEPDADSSWVQNRSYREKNCFLGLLGQHYDVPTENLGIPGGSLQSTVWNYLWWLEHQDDPSSTLIIVFLTEPDRHSFFNPNAKRDSSTPDWDRYCHSTWIEYGSSTVPEPFRDLGKRFMTMTHCRELSKLNYLQTALFFDGQAARLGMPLLQFHTTWPESDYPIATIPWPDFNWILFFRDHPGNQQRELIKTNGHPNELGHGIIQDMLIPEIDRVILTK